MKYMKRSWLIRAVLCMLVISMLAGAVTGCRKKKKTAEPAETPAAAEQTADGDERPAPEEVPEEPEEVSEKPGTVIEEIPEGPLLPDKNGSYTSKDDVALYIHTYGQLPGNYITKQEAEYLGWDSREGNLDEVAPGKSIGGDRFGNYEGYLPKAKGRKYYECDVNYYGGYRGGERIVYSNDGYVFYTKDHYNTFETLYEPD